MSFRRNGSPRIGRPLASIASSEAFFIDGEYYALSRSVLKRNCKLTSKHLWPRVYCLQSDVALQDVILHKKSEALIYITDSSFL